MPWWLYYSEGGKHIRRKVSLSRQQAEEVATQIMEKLNRPEATWPKSWRHSFTTLLQDANVDPLIWQQDGTPTTG